MSYDDRDVMRLVELVQVTAAVIGVIASAFMTVETRLVKRIRGDRAVSSDRADRADRALEPARLGPLTRWHLSRLRSAGAVVAAPGGRWSIDEPVYRALRRRRVVLGVSLVVLAIAGVILVHTLAR